MILKESKNLDKARKMLQNREILDIRNARWFAKYIIDEYVKENKMETIYYFTPNMMYDEYVFDSIGVNRHGIVPNMHDELVKKSMEMRDKKGLESFLWYYFLSLGNDVIAMELGQKMMNDIFVFDNPAGYTYKQYLIHKESLVANTLGGDFLSRYKDFWLNFSEASIIGGTIFLDIVNDNFSDCTILNSVCDYFNRKVNYYKLNEYSGVRKELIDGVDTIIESHPDRFLTGESDLLLEFKLGGQKRNFFELMDVRRKITDNLENQYEFYEIPEIKDKLVKSLENKELLLGELVYNSLVSLDDDVVKEIISYLDENDLSFVEKSINHKLIEIQNILSFVESYEGPVDDTDKEDILNDWKFEESDCLRLQFIVEQKKLIKKAI